MDSISYTNANFSMIVFYDEKDDDESLMELHESYDNGLPLRVPCIGEKVWLSSYEHSYVNDRKPLFRHCHEVVDVISNYLENKEYENITVQYDIIVREVKQ